MIIEEITEHLVMGRGAMGLALTRPYLPVASGYCAMPLVARGSGFRGVLDWAATEQYAPGDRPKMGRLYEVHSPAILAGDFSVATDAAAGTQEKHRCDVFHSCRR
jgi:hypothetical protein